MSALPPPPRDAGGGITVTKWEVWAELHGGLLDACCVCEQSSGKWWRQGDRYYAVHERCVERLIELWAALGEEPGTTLAGAGLRGAYARRAGRAASAARPAVARTASVFRGSPYFRPGMPDGAPWMSVALTVAGCLVVPCGLNEDYARSTNQARRSSATADILLAGGVRLVGGHVVGPDGAVHDAWGQAVPLPGQEMPWEPIERATTWTTCRGCDAPVWPGRWVSRSGRCASVCLVQTSPRPEWPVDAEQSSPPVVLKRRAVKKGETLD